MIGDLLDYACWLAALVSIGAYVASLMRNRPYFRPFNSLGLLLTGAALLGLPTVIGSDLPDSAVPHTAYVVLTLIAAAAFQTYSALRRRKARAAEAK